MGNWQWNSNNVRAITVARDHLKSVFNTDFKLYEVLARVRALRNRFNIFEHMIACSGVEWDRQNNFVFASVDQWKTWRQVMSLITFYLTATCNLWSLIPTFFIVSVRYIHCRGLI